MDNPLRLLNERFALNLPDEILQEIVNTCAEIIVIQDKEEADKGHAKAAHETFGWEDESHAEDDERHCLQCGSPLFGICDRPFCNEHL